MSERVNTIIEGNIEGVLTDGMNAHTAHVNDACDGTCDELVDVGFTALHVDLQTGVLLWVTIMKHTSETCYRIIATSFAPTLNRWVSSGLHGSCSCHTLPLVEICSLNLHWNCRGRYAKKHEYLAVTSSVGVWATAGTGKILIPMCAKPYKKERKRHAEWLHGFPALRVKRFLNTEGVLCKNMKANM